MSNPLDEQKDERPTVVGTDPDFNVGDEDPTASERADGEEDDEDEVDVEDLP